MPNIPFPDIPNVPGVPSIARNPELSIDYGDLVSAVVGRNPLSIIESITSPQWGIYATTGSMEKIIEPDSVLSFEYRGEARIADYPIEAGGFKSYNKVQQPYDIRMRMSCEGAGTLTSLISFNSSGRTSGMTREDFISRLEAMKISLALYNLVTPDYVYANVNLVHFDYKRTNVEGVTMLVADLYLREIQQTTTATYKTVATSETVATDSAADAKEQGTMNTTLLTANENATIRILDTIGGIR